MKIAVLGTGGVGRALAGRLAEQGHDAVLGTRDPDVTLARTERDAMGNPPVGEWLEAHPHVGLMTYRAAAEFGELLINATNGAGSMAALAEAGADALAGKVLLDVANPLDFSKGMPPTLLVKDDDSLGETVQREFPGARVVKSLNTTNASVMIHPDSVGDGDTSIFVCGNDPAAKALVTDLLHGFGWRDVIDLGDITASRGVEMVLPLWVRLMSTLGTPAFNYKIVR